MTCQCNPVELGEHPGRTYFYTCSVCGHAGAHAVSKTVLTNHASKAAPACFQFNGTTAWSTPHESISGGCHPSQAEGFNKALKARGVTAAHYREDGVRVESTRGGRKEVNGMFGLVDFDGGYGD